jgi:hypothetical protein
MKNMPLIVLLFSLILVCGISSCSLATAPLNKAVVNESLIAAQRADQIIIEGMIAKINDFDSFVSKVSSLGLGSRLVYSISYDYGDLKLDGIENKLKFEYISTLRYSENKIPIGNLFVESSPFGDKWIVSVYKDYAGNPDLKVNGQDKLEVLGPSANRSIELTITRDPVVFEKKIIDFVVK